CALPAPPPLPPFFSHFIFYSISGERARSASLALSKPDAWAPTSAATSISRMAFDPSRRIEWERARRTVSSLIPRSRAASATRLAERYSGNTGSYESLRNMKGERFINPLRREYHSSFFSDFGNPAGSISAIFQSNSPRSAYRRFNSAQVCCDQKHHDDITSR